MRRVMRLFRAAVAAIAAVAATAVSAPAHAATLGNWDRHEQRAVVKAGLLPKLGDGVFHGERALTPGELSGALSRIGTGTGAVPKRRITVALFHRLVVNRLGLKDLANDVQGEAARAGLEPPARFGTEVVARQLGLRYDHPAQDDRLELYPTDPITRAEAAYSFAKILANPTGGPYYARATLERFELPASSAAQREAISLA